MFSSVPIWHLKAHSLPSSFRRLGYLKRSLKISAIPASCSFPMIPTPTGSICLHQPGSARLCCSNKPPPNFSDLRATKVDFLLKLHARFKLAGGSFLNLLPERSSWQSLHYLHGVWLSWQGNKRTRLFVHLIQKVSPWRGHIPFLLTIRWLTHVLGPGQTSRRWRGVATIFLEGEALILWWIALNGPTLPYCVM